jgi:GT2 family glycosyltransferase
MGQAVSAIIPTYNSGALIERCIDALAAASEVHEIVVLDGGSTDGTPDLAARRGARVLRFPGTLVSTRFNLAMREVSNELVLVLDDDSFVDPETPRRLAEAIERRPQLAVLQPRLRFEDGREHRSGSNYKTLRSEVLTALGLTSVLRRLEPGPLAPKERGMEEATWVPLIAAVVRRSAVQAIGGFDERFRFYYDDQDFCRRLTEAGWQIAVCWGAGAVHLGSASTAAKDPTGWFVQYQENRLVYLRKHYPRAWILFAMVWAVRSSLHVIAWRLRASVRGRRSDVEGARLARRWTEAFQRTALPRRPRP